MSRLTIVAALLCAVGCMELHGPTDGSLAEIKRQQEQRLMMSCVAENGSGATGAIGLAVVQYCRDDANLRVW
jgi:hypothetical protein